MNQEPTHLVQWNECVRYVWGIHWFCSHAAVHWFQIPWLLARSAAESRVWIILSTVELLDWYWSSSRHCSNCIGQNKCCCCIWTGLHVNTSSMWTARELHWCPQYLWYVSINLSWICTVWVKPPPLRFSGIFPKQLGIFCPNFTRLYTVRSYLRYSITCNFDEVIIVMPY